MMNDLISRQAAIDAIVNTVSCVGMHDNSEVARYGATFRQHEIIDIIETLPSAQTERRWTPVTEQLPKEKGEYMVTVEYYGWHGEKGRMLTSARYTKTKGWHLSSGKVIAWMPLPKPWKGEDND